MNQMSKNVFRILFYNIIMVVAIDKNQIEFLVKSGKIESQRIALQMGNVFL